MGARQFLLQNAVLIAIVIVAANVLPDARLFVFGVMVLGVMGQALWYFKKRLIDKSFPGNWACG
jgi:hypothetical protein